MFWTEEELLKLFPLGSIHIDDGNESRAMNEAEHAAWVQSLVGQPKPPEPPAV